MTPSTELSQLRVIRCVSSVLLRSFGPEYFGNEVKASLLGEGFGIFLSAINLLLVMGFINGTFRNAIKFSRPKLIRSGGGGREREKRERESRG